MRGLLHLRVPDAPDLVPERAAPAPAPPAVPGTYLLWLVAARARRVRVGARGVLPLEPGLYVYAGSALGAGGLRARVARHRRRRKPRHWHLDWLRPHLRLASVWYATGERRRECDWVRSLLAQGFAPAPLARIGASDCRCPAHLLRPPPGWDRSGADPWARACLPLCSFASRLEAEPHPTLR